MARAGRGSLLASKGMTPLRTLGALTAAALVCAAAAATPASAAHAHAHASIVGGSPAPAGAWPSIAYLRGSYHDNEGDEHGFACTGSVVAPQWVVTAGHCTLGDGTKAPEEMTVTLGVTDYDDPNGQHVSVDRFVTDPDYDTNSERDDAGLVHLSQPVSTPAMALAAPSTSYSSPSGTPNAAGWGATDTQGTQIESRLMQAYLQIHSPQDCSRISGFDSSAELCAGTQGSAGACFGDSGGPLVEFNSATPVLVGITSYGPQGEAGLEPCSTDLPAVYTSVAAVSSFIRSTIDRASPAPVAQSQPAVASTTSCTKAQAQIGSARKREQTARTRLRAARRQGAGTHAARLARRNWLHAVQHRRAVARVATRRCAS
jgi:secreted trypsin-like serine protease